jgi:hypothetical protein
MKKIDLLDSAGLVGGISKNHPFPTCHEPRSVARNTGFAWAGFVKNQNKQEKINAWRHGFFQFCFAQFPECNVDNPDCGSPVGHLENTLFDTFEHLF